MELVVQKREKLGRITKELRKEGTIPAELYGRGIENIHLSVQLKDFRKVFKAAGETTVINLVLGNEKHPVLIQGVTYHPVKDGIESIDFYKVRMDEKLKVKIPVEFFGISVAVKDKNGVLIKALKELEIEALPANIPHDIKVDISKLDEIGKSIYVKNLNIPADVKVMVSGETVVATIIEKVSEEKEAAMQQAAAGGVEGVKVEVEEKKAERATEAAAAAPVAGAGAEPKKEEKKVGKKA